MRPFILALFIAIAAGAQGVWERRADYPISATEVSAAAIGDRIYSVCGLAATGSTSELFIYNPAADEWTRGAPVPIPGGADHCNVAAANGRLYLAGAIRIGGSFVDGNTYEYNPATNEWTTVGRMTIPRGAGGIASDGRRLYVAGGLAPNSSVPSFEVFDTETRQWSVLPSMPTPRDHLTAQFVNGRFYAIAGRNTRDLAIVEEFDPAAGTWRTRASAPTARGGLASAQVNGKIYVMGGEGNSGTPEATFRQNEEYDPAADRWRSLPDMPTPRHGLYGAAIGTVIYTPSGGPVAGANYSNRTEAFIVPPAEPPALSGPPLNAASYDPDAAEGMLMTVFGRNLAPGTQTAKPAAQMLGVRATLNGAAMQLLYVTPSQLAFRLPNGAASGDFRVQHAGVESAAVPLRIAGPARPGIFTLSQDGKGPGAILPAPARRGGAVEIYCTGLGATLPPTEGLERTQLVPQVEIGGRDADVLFSGLSPGLFGVYQVNARVPLDSATGAAVEVRLRAGGAVSNTVTMAVTGDPI